MYSIGSNFVVGDKGYFSSSPSGLFYNNVQVLSQFTTQNFTSSAQAIYRVRYSLCPINLTSANLFQIHFISNLNLSTNNSSNNSGYLNVVEPQFSLSNNSTTLSNCPTLVYASLNGPFVNLNTATQQISTLFTSYQVNNYTAGFYAAGNNGQFLNNFGIYGFGQNNGQANDVLDIEIYPILNPNTTYYICTFVGYNGNSNNFTGYQVNGIYEYFCSYPKQ